MDIPQIFRGVTVLVVDDHRTTRYVAGLVLEKHGATVLEAEDGSVALQLLAVHRIDAIVSDVQMPKLDGFGLLRALGYPSPKAGTPPVHLHSSVPGDFQADADSLSVRLHSKGNLLTGLAPQVAALIGIPYPGFPSAP